MGVLGEHALSVLKYVIDETIQLPPMTAGTLPSLPPMSLIVRTFGDDKEQAQALASQVDRWDASGRPSERKLHIYAYGNEQAFVPTTQDIVIKKQWTRFLFRW
jgi:hypothetical protein